MNPRMSRTEIDLFVSFVRSAGRYFEFGMGGSTVIASKYRSNSIFAVDSDLSWIEAVQNIIGSRSNTTLIHADIGKTKQWGYPAGPLSKEVCAKYHTLPLDQISDVDFFLIDGRFRVACACSAALVAYTNTVFAIHDYRSRRSYHKVEEFLKPIAESEDLTIFLRKRDCDFDKIRHLRNMVAQAPI